MTRPPHPGSTWRGWGAPSLHLGSMRGRITLVLAGAALAALGAVPAVAGTQKLPRLGMEVVERSGDVIRVKLTCPVERVTCEGTAKFKGKKRKGERTYRLAAEPFEFDRFKGGRRKTIKFRLSDTAKETIERAGGMTVTVIVDARYGAGKGGKIRRKAELSP